VLAGIGLLALLLAAAPARSAEPETFVVYFDFASAKLSEASRPLLIDAVAAIKRALAETSGAHVKIVGYADSVGSIFGAMHVSLRRAEAVRRELLSGGIAAGDIAVEGRGKREPEVQTGDQVRNPRNRRVRIIIYRPGD
jgi:outer membrane protein OmpA-like peptidoglycan-associated protein